MKYEFLDDSNGKQSSKRLWGSLLLGNGVFLAVVLFVVSVVHGAADAITALNIIHIFLIAGSGLLGIGILEKGKKT